MPPPRLLLIPLLLTATCGCGSGAARRASPFDLASQPRPIIVANQFDDPYRTAVVAAIWADGRVLRLRSQTRLVNSYELGTTSLESLAPTLEHARSLAQSLRDDVFTFVFHADSRGLQLFLDGRDLQTSWEFYGFPDRTPGGDLIQSIFNLELSQVSYVRLKDPTQVYWRTHGD
jgi:hypothetical protein